MTELNILDILNRSGSLSDNSSMLIRDFAEKWELSLFEAIVECKVIAREDVAESLSRVLKLPLFMDFPAASKNIDALRRISFKDARNLCALPVNFNAENRSLQVVIDDPTDSGKVRSLQQLSGCKVQLAVSDPQLIRDTIDAWYSAPEQILV